VRRGGQEGIAGNGKEHLGMAGDGWGRWVMARFMSHVVRRILLVHDSRTAAFPVEEGEL